MKLFFKLIRLILTPVVLFLDWVTTPRGIKREESLQNQYDRKADKLKLYHFRACPFCIKVRRAIKRMSLNIEPRDAQHIPLHRDTLLQEGGKLQVPCLRIESDNGEVRWLYESDAIVSYLQEQFSA